MSSEADLWGSEDPDYIEAIANASLPCTSKEADTSTAAGGGAGGVKRKRSSSPGVPVISTSEAYEVDLDTHYNVGVLDEGGEEDAGPSSSAEVDMDLNPDVNPALFTRQGKRERLQPDAKNESYVYGAAKFGGFGEYMFRKRAKLQIQNQGLEGEGATESDGRKPIFKGVSVYVNGFTDPPFQDLREMIMAHGGVFQAYLDRKSLVTHIIASQLTPSKIIEFQKAKMKVVTPEWIVKSVEAGTRLRWQDFALRPGSNGIAAHGKGTAFAGADGAGSEADRSVKPSQKTLLDSLVTQSRKPDKATRPDTKSSSSSKSFRQMIAESSGSSQSQKSQVGSPLAPPKLKPVAKPTSPIPQDGEASLVLQPSHTTSVPTPVEAVSSDDTLKTPSPVKNALLQTLPLVTTTSPTPTKTLGDPQTATGKPRYAQHDSNPLAAKLMQSTQWRNEHTSANAAAFTESYFQNSRLHHLSTWKSELRKLVAEARERAENGNGVADESDHVQMDGVSMLGAQLVGPARSANREKGKGKASNNGAESTPERVIMHCDFDSFFVAAGIVDRPELKGKPVVVCHSGGGGGGGRGSTSEIASAGYEARKFGVKNGMSLGQARQLCPDIQTIPYEFERYKKFSLQFYTILMSFADDLQAVSVDEALIDVSQRVAQARAYAVQEGADDDERDFAKELAQEIRDEVRKATSCEVSIGISHNILLARMATRKAKPAGSYHLLLSEVPDHLAPLEIKAIHGVGHSIRDKIKEKLNVETLGELLPKSKQSLQHVLGEKTGDKIWKAVRGIDDTQLESDKPRKSVSAEVNYGIRFENEEQAEAFIYTLAAEVSKRLKTIGRKGKSLTLKIMVRHPDAPREAPKFMGHGLVEVYNKSVPVSEPGAGSGHTDDPTIIGNATWNLMKSFTFDPRELRGIGIQIQKLDDEVKVDPGQSRLQFRKALDDPLPATAKLKGKGKEKADDVEALQPELPSGAGEDVVAQKASERDRGRLDLPPASQIDPTVLESLPEDIRREILSGLGAPVTAGTVVDVGAAAGPSRRVASPSPFSADDAINLEDDPEIMELQTESRHQSRSQSVTVPHISQPRHATLELPSIALKATSVSPTKLGSKAAGARHITKQLAPKRKAPVLSPTKISLFNGKGRANASATDIELQALGVDPAFFRELPLDIQQEQLSHLKQSMPMFAGKIISAQRGASLPVPDDRRSAASRASSRSRSPSAGLGHGADRQPLPAASYTAPPQIKKLTEAGDVQDMVKEWVKYRQDDGPIAGEVDRMAVFLVKCAETDTGLEKVLAIMRLWRLVLRNHWVAEEKMAGVEEGPGRIWWQAFRETKGKVDQVVRRRFGCNLALGK